MTDLIITDDNGVSQKSTTISTGSYSDTTNTTDKESSALTTPAPRAGS